MKHGRCWIYSFEMLNHLLQQHWSFCRIIESNYRILRCAVVPDASSRVMGSYQSVDPPESWRELGWFADMFRAICIICEWISSFRSLNVRSHLWKGCKQSSIGLQPFCAVGLTTYPIITHMYLIMREVVVPGTSAAKSLIPLNAAVFSLIWTSGTPPC